MSNRNQIKKKICPPGLKNIKLKDPPYVDIYCPFTNIKSLYKKPAYDRPDLAPKKDEKAFK